MRSQGNSKCVLKRKASKRSMMRTKKREDTKLGALRETYLRKRKSKKKNTE
jgi:hypothetical protein